MKALDISVGKQPIRRNTNQSDFHAVLCHRCILRRTLWRDIPQIHDLRYGHVSVSVEPVQEYPLLVVEITGNIEASFDGRERVLPTAVWLTPKALFEQLRRLVRQHC